MRIKVAYFFVGVRNSMRVSSQSSAEAVMENRRVLLRGLNPYITCYVCKGYLIDATTVSECLHAFCKSCLVAHLREKTTCPKCEIVIHQSHPLNYIMHDRNLQDIVYKLVPNLYRNEMQRREMFYQEHNLPFENPLKTERKNESADNFQESKDNHAFDEQVSIFFKSDEDDVKLLDHPYVCCSSQATITVLKKYLAMALYGDISRFLDFDILCNSEVLGKDHSLKFITRTRWRNSDLPLRLNYRKHVEL
ncbi:hypothetical protein M514_13440 [Trichuris suis]|uniref:RING-type domain-containing protein n=1 Tax=Trichuris suis TaxID=68888 RepID=A0A085LL34_9BILA|nr:hypothetical protein M513_13440 [Trichuris suis]KFD72478.1 hypothetical protein M514_13440 [Trichuris suis]